MQYSIQEEALHLLKCNLRHIPGGPIFKEIYGSPFGHGSRPFFMAFRAFIISVTEIVSSSDRQYIRDQSHCHFLKGILDDILSIILDDILSIV